MNYQADYQKERSDNKRIHDALTVEVAAHLGEGWSVKRYPPADEESYSRLPDIVHTDGRSFDLSPCTYPHSDIGKVNVSANWPTPGGEHNPRVMPSDLRNPEEQHPTIKVSISRGAATIAKEINRRFLPEYTRILGRIREKIQRDNEWEAGKDATFARLCTEVGLPDRMKHTHDLKTHHYPGPGADGGYGDIVVNSPDSVSIKFSSVPADVAIRALKVLCGGGQ